MSYGKGAPPALSGNLRSSDHMLFEKRHVSANTRPQNSAGDIKDKKTHKSKAFLLFKRY